MCLRESPQQPGLRGSSRTRTEVEKPEDPVHGVLDVGRVVFQAKDEELLFIENGEPVQKIHGVQPDLQPHLGPEEKALPRQRPQHRRRFPTRDALRRQATPSDPSEHVPPTLGVKRCGFSLLARISTQVSPNPRDDPVGSATTRHSGHGDKGRGQGKSPEVCVFFAQCPGCLCSYGWHL